MKINKNLIPKDKPLKVEIEFFKEKEKAMNEEEKKAIEKIKEIIECFYCFPNPINIELKDCDCSSLEIVLNLIEKLQKENELAKKQVEYDKTHICNPQIIKLNYIPIRKIKNKIKEIKARKGKDCIPLYEIQREAKIDVLQELLEESE